MMLKLDITMAATKIKNILVSIVTSLGTVLVPRASYYIQQGNVG